MSSSSSLLSQEPFHFHCHHDVEDLKTMMALIKVIILAPPHIRLLLCVTRIALLYVNTHIALLHVLPTLYCYMTYPGIAGLESCLIITGCDGQQLSWRWPTAGAEPGNQPFCGPHATLLV